MTTEKEFNSSENPELAMPFFNELWPKAYPLYSKIPLATEVARKFVDDGVITIGGLLERSIAKAGRLSSNADYG